MTPTDQLVERLHFVSEWKKLIEQHRRKTDDPAITYVLKDGSRIHEDDSSVAKVAAALSRALEDASAVATEAATRLTELTAELEALRARMAGVDEKALEAAAKVRWERVRNGWTSEMSRPVAWERLTQFERLAYIDEDRAAITAYLAASKTLK